MQQKSKDINCYHCGNNCNDTSISLEDKIFCCLGCKTVFEILQSNDMENFYNLNSSPGVQDLTVYTVFILEKQNYLG